MLEARDGRPRNKKRSMYSVTIGAVVFLEILFWWGKNGGGVVGKLTLPVWEENFKNCQVT